MIFTFLTHFNNGISNIKSVKSALFAQSKAHFSFFMCNIAQFQQLSWILLKFEKNIAKKARCSLLTLVLYIYELILLLHHNLLLLLIFYQRYLNQYQIHIRQPLDIQPYCFHQYHPLLKIECVITVLS